MQYIDFDRLDDIKTSTFQQAYPYPWINPYGVLTDEAYQRLYETMPTLDQMVPSFGKKRSHGQRPHDRYALEYNENVDLHPAWQEFIAELQSDRYHAFIRRMFGRGRFNLHFHWHYAPPGSSVSPHCDAKRKLGSHIFYFSPEGEWKPEWGGETVVLDDHGRFTTRSAPEFEDFDQQFAGQSIGNYSLLFQRQERSWHGVKEIACPEGMYRKVFIVVINDKLRAGLRRMKARLAGEMRRDF